MCVWLNDAMTLNTFAMKHEHSLKTPESVCVRTFCRDGHVKISIPIYIYMCNYILEILKICIYAGTCRGHIFGVFYNLKTRNENVINYLKN